MFVAKSPKGSGLLSRGRCRMTLRLRNVGYLECRNLPFSSCLHFHCARSSFLVFLLIEFAFLFFHSIDTSSSSVLDDFLLLHDFPPSEGAPFYDTSGASARNTRLNTTLTQACLIPRVERTATFLFRTRSSVHVHSFSLLRVHTIHRPSSS